MGEYPVGTNYGICNKEEITGETISDIFNNIDKQLDGQ
jgi:hypothetical protein